MVSKDIGILYYGLPQSPNPRSVLYNEIAGLQELDNVGEDFEIRRSRTRFAST